MRHVRTRATLAALCLAVTACTGGADAEEETGQAATIVQPGAPGQPSKVLDPDDLPEVEDVPHTEADVAFMQGMISHHVQALRMTRLVPDRSARDDIPLFSERMDISQESELEVMRAWLEARGEDVPSLSADHDHGDDPAALMPGMLTEQELRELEAAEGEAFDRLFLEGMLRHHGGAIAMVDQLMADGGGLEPEINRFADHVRSDQEIEILRMQAMLEELDAA